MHISNEVASDITNERRRTSKLSAVVVMGLVILSLIHPPFSEFRAFVSFNFLQPVQHTDELFKQSLTCSLISIELVFSDYDTSSPSSPPSLAPSTNPTYFPTSPTKNPSTSPTLSPSTSPFSEPTKTPTSLTLAPTSINAPTKTSVPYTQSHSAYSTSSTNMRTLYEERGTGSGDNIEETSSEERFRVLPVRASLFPPVKHIYLSPLRNHTVDRKNNSSSPGDSSSSGSSSSSSSSRDPSTVALLSFAPQLTFFLKGVHRTLRPELYRLVRGELRRFCGSSVSRSWAQEEGEGEEDAMSAPLAVLQEITLELLLLNDKEGEADNTAASGGNQSSPLAEHLEEEKQRLLRVHSSEGYRLLLTSASSSSFFSGHLTAYSVAGLLHGLSTLAQLGDAPHLLPMPLEILDWPASPWRGLLVDTARHFFPLSSLRRTIDAMQMVKLNTLHLHLSDAQAFPVQLLDVGNLSLSSLSNEHSYLRTADKDGGFTLPNNIATTQATSVGGSYSDSSSSGTSDSKLYSYTLRDLKRLVQYAANRGITVVPEIDMPAHTFSWAQIFPEILVNCTQTVKARSIGRSSPQIDVYILDPTKALTLKVITAMLTQLAEVFPSPYMHVGGDEVVLECWEEDETLMAWVHAHNTTLPDLFKTFEEQIFAVVRTLGKIPMSWQGLIDMQALPATPTRTSVPNGSSTVIPPPSILGPWKCWGGLAGHAASEGKGNDHPIVTSACWYLDFDSEWNDYLRVDPVATAREAPVPSSSPTRAPAEEEHTTHPPSMSQLPSAVLDTKPHLVWGGEASMWTEHVDVTNLDCRLWPRGGAIATSLWGLDVPSQEILAPRATGSISDDDLKYFLVSRGVAASALTFHEVDNTSPSRYYRSYLPRTFSSEQDVYRYVDNQNTLPISGYKRFDIGSLHLTSQCPVIDSDVFRPLTSRDLEHWSDDEDEENVTTGSGMSNAPINARDSSSTQPTNQHVVHNTIRYDVFKAVQINAADGFPGDRLDLMTSWLKSKANDGVDIIGMCELNTWHTLESTSVYHLQKNFPLFRSYAASAGFVHSHVMHSKKHPYNIGIMSSLPFTVLHEYRPPLFERGVLHVWFRTIDVHVLVAHLNAHDSLQRESEANVLASVVTPLVQQGKRVILMGDLNSLSPLDQELHREGNLADLIRTQPMASLPDLRRKLLNTTGSINYKPIQTLLDSGLQDSCAVSCARQAHVVTATESARAIGDDVTSEEEVSRCMRYMCSSSEPTLYNPEWSSSVPQPKVRLDFILVSPALLQSPPESSLNNHSTDFIESSNSSHPTVTATSTNKHTTTSAALGMVYDKVVAGGVEVNNQTLHLSDHFPVYFYWREAVGT